MAIGDAYIDVHANMGPFDREIAHDTDKIARDQEGDFRRAGHRIGDTMGEEASETFAGHGRQFGERLREEVRRRPIHVKQHVDVDYDLDRDRIGAEIREAIAEATGPGSPLSRVGHKLGLAFGDAFGAGFGVSGRSALIPFIVILVGVIVGLIVAAVQAVNALVAVLTTIPAVLLGIGLQVGVLLLAFKGLGTAISGAFAAKNAKELNDAIKDLTPSAQAFVKTLLPLRDLFNYLKRVSQEAFFKELGPVVSELQEILGPILGFNLAPLAAAMGRFLRSLAMVFASPAFARLLEDIIPATIKWLDKFGPGFAKFLIGWIEMADRALPFLNAIGGMLANGLASLGEWLGRVSSSKGFQSWLKDMQTTLDSVVGLLGAAFQFVGSFMDALNEQGGVKLIDAFTTAFLALAAYFQSPTGQEAMRGFVNLLILTLDTFVVLTVVIFTVIAAIQAFFDWLGGTAIPAIEGFFEALGKAAATGTAAIGAALVIVKDQIVGILNRIKLAWHNFQTAISDRVSTIVEVIRTLPARMLGALGDIYNALYRRGQAIVQGLIDGIRSMGKALAEAAHWLTAQIAKFFPGSPAKEGPFSGEGYALYRGQHLVRDFVKGIQMEVPQMRTSAENLVNNITFGPGSVSVGFEGAVPTPEQARVTGAAAGQGIVSQLAARDVRLAVRTM